MKWLLSLVVTVLSFAPACAQQQLSGYALDVPYPSAVLLVVGVTQVAANSGPGSYPTPSCHVTYRIYQDMADLTYDQQQRNAAALAGTPYTGIELTDAAVDIVDSGHISGGSMVWDSTPYTTYMAPIADWTAWSAVQGAAYAAMKVQGNTQDLMAGATAAQ